MTSSPSTRWLLKFETGAKVAGATFSRLVSTIENLQSDNDNSWIILEPIRSDGKLSGFLQVACVEPGLYIVEVRLIEANVGQQAGFWKAGRVEPMGAVLSKDKKGLYKTYENEQLTSEEVIAIADTFYTQMKLNSDFNWRSIQDDLEASGNR